MICKPKLCCKCGEKYIPNSNSQKYCIECRKRVCENCGKIFTIECSQYEKRFCSKKCVIVRPDVVENLIKNRGDKKKKQCWDKCKVCGEEFEHWESRNAKYCSKECWGKRGIKILKYCPFCSKEFLDYLSSERKYCSRKCYGNHKKILCLGKNSHFWKGGITPLNQMIRTSDMYMDWRKAVFERDNYTCIWCGVRGSWLEVHHIKRFYILIEENNITTLQEALDCNELWEINNGITYCKDCHMELHGLSKRNDVKVLKTLGDYK